MSAIVRKHYPIHKLPPDLRAELPQHGWVDLEIRPETHRAFEPSDLAPVVGTGENVDGSEHRDFPITQILEAQRSRRACTEDPVTRVRTLRSEWQDREEAHDRIRRK